MPTRFSLRKFFINLWNDERGGIPPADQQAPTEPTAPPPGANDRTHRNWMVEELNRPEPGEPEPASSSETDAAPNEAAPATSASTGAATQPEQETAATPETPEGEQPAEAATTDDDDEELELAWEKDGTAEAATDEPEEEIPQQGAADPETGLTPEQDRQAREALKQYLFSDNPEAEKALGLVLSTNRGKRMIDAFKWERAVREEPGENGEGGLGYRPTIQQMRDWMEDHYAMQRMQEDFRSGIPDKTHQVLDYFFGADQETGQLRPGAQQAIQQLPDMLASNEATLPLYGSMANRFVRGFAEHIKQQAAQKQAQYGDSETGQKWRDFYANGLTVIDHVLSGGRPSDGANGAVNGAAPQPNGATRQGQESPEAQRLREENERLRQQVGQAQTADEENYNSQFHVDADGVVNEAAAAVLKPFKSMYSEYAFNGLVEKVGQELLSTANRDKIFLRDVGHLLRQAYEHKDPQVREQALRRYQQKIGSVAKRHAPDFRARLRNTSNQQKQASDARHERLAAGQDRTDPTSASGDPINPQAQEMGQRKPGETTHDYMMRELSA